MGNCCSCLRSSGTLDGPSYSQIDAEAGALMAGGKKGVAASAGTFGGEAEMAQRQAAAAAAQNQDAVDQRRRAEAEAREASFARANARMQQEAEARAERGAENGPRL